MSFVASVEWDEPLFDDMVNGILVDDCGKKPVVILNDMVEQHYRKERLPKVSVMDKNTVLNRRLQIAFPSYPIRAALESKQKTISSADKVAGADNKGGLYLFAAIPSSDPFLKTMAAVRRAHVSISGFGLLPIESAAMVSTLAKKLGGEEKGKMHWTVFIGQHQNGGLRQVITRNGELALTRMTAITDKDGDSGLWARDVVGELKSTMSYLSRFGYGGNDVLDVIIVSEADAAKHLKAMIEIPCRLHLVLVQEAAQSLGIKIDNQDNPRYAEALHAAWSAGKAKLVLPMKATQIESIEKPQQIAMVAMLALLAGFGFMGYQIFTSTQSVISTANQIADKQQISQRVEREYQQEIERKEALGLNVQLIQNSLAVYEELQGAAMRPLPAIISMANAMGPTLKLDAFKMVEQREALTNFRQNRSAEPEVKKFDGFLQLSFDPATDPEIAVAEVNKLKQRLEMAFPDNRVEITKQAFNAEVSTTFMGETERITEETAEQSDLTAELAVRGVSQ
ncbi:MAG: hypothetical protein AAF569_06485 [Pseudomonadota bacterium]